MSDIHPSPPSPPSSAEPLPPLPLGLTGALGRPAVGRLTRGTRAFSSGIGRGLLARRRLLGLGLGLDGGGTDGLAVRPPIDFWPGGGDEAHPLDRVRTGDAAYDRLVNQSRAQAAATRSATTHAGRVGRGLPASIHRRGRTLAGPRTAPGAGGLRPAEIRPAPNEATRLAPSAAASVASKPATAVAGPGPAAPPRPGPAATPGHAPSDNRDLDAIRAAIAAKRDDANATTGAPQPAGTSSGGTSENRVEATTGHREEPPTVPGRETPRRDTPRAHSVPAVPPTGQASGQPAGRAGTASAPAAPITGAEAAQRRSASAPVAVNPIGTTAGGGNGATTTSRAADAVPRASARAAGPAAPTVRGMATTAFRTSAGATGAAALSSGDAKSRPSAGDTEAATQWSGADGRVPGLSPTDPGGADHRLGPAGQAGVVPGAVIRQDEGNADTIRPWTATTADLPVRPVPSQPGHPGGPAGTLAAEAAPAGRTTAATVLPATVPPVAGISRSTIPADHAAGIGAQLGGTATGPVAAAPPTRPDGTAEPTTIDGTSRLSPHDGPPTAPMPAEGPTDPGGVRPARSPGTGVGFEPWLDPVSATVTATDGPTTAVPFIRSAAAGQEVRPGALPTPAAWAAILGPQVGEGHPADRGQAGPAPIGPRTNEVGRNSPVGDNQSQPGDGAPASRPHRAEPSGNPGPVFLREIGRGGRDRPSALPARFRPLARALVGAGPVRTVTGPATMRALHQVGAPAATIGTTIYTAAPLGSSVGDHALVAHELTHVAHRSPRPRFFDDPRPSSEERLATAVGAMAYDLSTRSLLVSPGGLPAGVIPAAATAGATHHRAPLPRVTTAHRSPQPAARTAPAATAGAPAVTIRPGGTTTTPPAATAQGTTPSTTTPRGGAPLVTVPRATSALATTALSTTALSTTALSTTALSTTALSTTALAGTPRAGATRPEPGRSAQAGTVVASRSYAEKTTTPTVHPGVAPTTAARATRNGPIGIRHSAPDPGRPGTTRFGTAGLPVAGPARAPVNPGPGPGPDLRVGPGPELGPAGANGVNATSAGQPPTISRRLGDPTRGALSQAGSGSTGAAGQGDGPATNGPAAGSGGGGGPATTTAGGSTGGATQEPTTSSFDDIDRLVEILEERLLAELERRGARFRGGF